MEGGHMCHFIFKAPYALRKLCVRDQKQVAWVSRNVTHLEWREGTTPYIDLPVILRKLHKKYMTKGANKIHWLRKVGRLDVEPIDDDKTNTYWLRNEGCLHHDERRCAGFYMCALRNVRGYKIMFEGEHSGESRGKKEKI